MTQTDLTAPPSEEATTAEPEEASQADELPSLTVVGIGASAGGLEAASRLLAALPRCPGMAVVLVQHLDPHQQSMLPEILTRTTKMPVHEAQDGTRWQEDHVYVMPASAQIKLVDGILRLAPRPAGLNHPVDQFFQSLAAAPSVRAIGVVLSGNGTDGTKGLRAIKSSGGLTFAQDSASAKFDSMPRNAVQSGCVDLVLPPEEIAAELIKVGRHPYWFSLHSPPPPEETANAVDAVLDILGKATNVDFSFYKRSTLERRILRRVVLHRLEGIEPYVDLLSKDRDEVHALFNDVLIHVTSFFRDPSLNEALRTIVFPRLVKDRPAERPIRVWVPGCSTGEEAYSLAILLDEYLQEQHAEVPIQIFATDLSDIAVDRARAGIYPETISADVSPERLHRYFENSDHRFQVRRRIRERCVFARQDITKDPPFSHLDLISCCNVLIYLGPVLQKRVIPLFHYALKPEGILVLGASESTGPFSDLFEPLDRKNRIYLRRAPSVPAILPLMGRTERGHQGAKLEGQPVGDRALLDLHREADRLLLTHYAPAGVLVDENLEILHFRGRTEPFLEPPSGEALFNLMGMVRKGLWEPVHLALQQAREERTEVIREGLRVRAGGETREVRLRVLPVSVPPDRPRGLLVLFETVGVDTVRSQEATIAPEDRGDELKRLNQELVATRYQLQSAIENHQTATEEILSANEELQSTNEEMETAKEELQSANEELMTLNDELRTRNLELSVAYSDLNNVLSSANIPFLILGRDLKIRRITPMAEKVLNVIPSDVGRSIRDIRLNLEVPDLQPLLEGVLENLMSREQEVKDARGRRYLLRVRPYRSLDEHVDGVVMAFMDIEEARQNAERANSLVHDADVERRAGETERSLSSMIDGMTDAFYATDRAWRLVIVNQEGARLLRRTKDELIGKNLWEVWPEMESSVRLGELRRVMDERVSVNLELHLEGNERTYRLRAHPSQDGLFLYLLDVTEKRDFDRLAGRANELEKSNVQLERFTYVVAHDLQEPLRTIAGYTQLLEKRLQETLGEEEREFLGFVAGGVGRMQLLLRDLLAYSRVDIKKSRPGRVDCEKIVKDALLDLNAAITEAGASVEHGELPVVRGDESQLSQVFRNLIANALKFAAPDRPPRVEILVSRDQDTWIFEVRDNGIGIAKESVDEIFLLFKRLHSDQDYPGTGLGLAISRRIVERHRGRIWATSSLGQGSSFFFTLPVSADS